MNMLIGQEVTFCDFCDAFRDMNRNDSFSYEGKKALHEYLEQLAADIGETIQLDVIAIDCEYVEYSDIDEYKADYNNSVESVEDISDHTQVIDIPGSDRFIIAQY